MGRIVFAATMIAIGIMGLVQGGFAPIWTPPLKHWPDRGAIALATSLVSLAGGLGMLRRRWLPFAAGGLGVVLVLWMLAAKGPPLLAAPTSAVAWESLGETAVLAAAAIVLAGRRWPARILYGGSLLAFGWSHLAYLKATAGLVPAWLPGRQALAELTGATYLAAGAAVLTGVLARPAAMLVAVQIGLFTLLVWGPQVGSGAPSADAWSEFVISASLTAAGWAIAESYGAARWPRLPGLRRRVV